MTFSCRADFEVAGDIELSAEEEEELLQKKKGEKLNLLSQSVKSFNQFNLFLEAQQCRLYQVISALIVEVVVNLLVSAVNCGGGGGGGQQGIFQEAV